MKRNNLLLLAFSILIGCESDKPSIKKDQINDVLMLKVDYTSNVFEGGKEFDFSRQSDSFTIVNEYKAPGDFGSVKLVYEEINEVLFFGEIHWMGLGKMKFPVKLQPSDEFIFVDTEDYVTPANGFENVFDPNMQRGKNFDYGKVWASVQNLAKVREYLGSAPGQTVKIFLYTPSVGAGNPADWDWIIYLRK